MNIAPQIDYSYSGIPAALRSRPNWVLWGVDPTRPKAPRQAVNPDYGAAANDPGTWCEFDRALIEIMLGTAQGLGYEIAPADGLVFIDFDHCLNDAGELLEPFKQWHENLPGYWELSQSGTGLHGFVRGTLPDGCKHKQHIPPNGPAAVELYDRGRYCAMTGILWGPQGTLDSVADAQPGIDTILAQMSAQRGTEAAGSVPTEALPDIPDCPADEAQAILQDALQHDADFAQLYYNTERGEDESKQDHALACAAYRATRFQLSAGNLWEILTASPWVNSKDGPHLRKWNRADYQRRTLTAAYNEAKAKDSAATLGFTPVPTSAPRMFTAAELDGMELPPVKWVVPGMLPAGLALIVAAPKIGKSWLALDLCLAVAAGRKWLGKEVNQGATLYLALEDSPQRLQSRMRLLSDGFTPAPTACTMATTAPMLGMGLLEMLDGWTGANPNARLVCVDTFQRIRPPAGKNENAYSADYRTCGALQSWAIQHGICLLLIHHTRKTINPGDVFDSISGSNGIFGSADAVLNITKANRFDDTATLSITGRDVDQTEYSAQFDKTAHRWQLLGTVEQQEQQAIENSPVVRTIQDLTLAGEWRGTVQELADEVLDRFPAADIPTSAQGMRSYFAKVWPALQGVGVTHTVTREAKQRTHVLKTSN